MKTILFLAAAAIAVPALAQATAGPADPSVTHRLPTCAQGGTCPMLSSVAHRQLGMAPAAVPAMGGPFEPVGARTYMPPPTVGDYPPCRPGPGDDRCIQLYERGVGRR